MKTSRWNMLPAHVKVAGGTGGRVIGQKKATKKRAPTVHAEDDEQASFFHWASFAVVRHPELAALYSIPNGAHLAGSDKQRWAQMARLKKTGLKPGVSDVCLPVARGPYGSLWVEMKAPGKLGNMSNDQKAWGVLMESLGNKFVCCDSWEAAAAAIEKYLEAKHD